MQLAELLASGFYNALVQFKNEFFAQQKEILMVFTERLTQIASQQQSQDQAIAAISSAVSNIENTIVSETAQVAEGVKTLSDTNAQLTQTNTEQAQQIASLLAQLEQKDIDLEQATQLAQQVFDKSGEQLAAQQELINKISQANTNIQGIFNP